jgi:PBP1b-binding outer membrane lipoprotein LpoB
MIKKWICCCLMAALLLLGCASADRKAQETKNQPAPVTPNGFFTNTPSDRDMYQAALAQIRAQEKQPNYSALRAELADLIQKHPNSRLSESAQAIIQLLDTVSALQADARDQKKKAQLQQTKLVKENEGLRDQIRMMEDSCSADLIRLQQENETLKENLQQLKKLEVQLEKREKMLR